MLPRNTACTPDGRPAIHRRAALHHSGQRGRFELIHDPGLDAHKACVSITQRCPDTNLEYPRHFFRRLFSAAEPSPFNKSPNPLTTSRYLLMSSFASKRFTRPFKAGL